MKRFLIITNSSKDEGLRLTHLIKEYIEKKGCVCRIEERSTQGGNDEIDLVRTEVDCALVLGGDGTMVRAVRDMTGTPIPVIGVNLGTLGYLCEVEEENVFNAVDRIINDDYEIEDRVQIIGSTGNGSGVSEQMAINDIVIYRAGNLQVVSLNVYVNDSFLCNYHADGLIIATPTGSTAYSMSAGGPIMDPKASMIVLTPINAQIMNAHSIVIPSEDEVRVELVRRNSGANKLEESVEIAFDGDNIASLGIGESIVIRQAPEMAKFLKLSSLSFIERLQKKMSMFNDRSNG